MFKDILQDAFDRTDGIIMMALLGMDGLPIERIIKPREECPDFEEDLLSAQYSTLLKNVEITNRDIGLEGTREILVSTDAFLVVINRVGDDLLVVSLVSSTGNLGRARYENKKAATRLEQEI